ncbi:hypothetical protein I8U20_12685 [Thermoactinomyces intermedius]|uniref:Uncharacterized protein n=1 Tax=Thermoactinomyces intermedius TaxID=2024 RepID=A0A8I1DD40_THEIN|nr:hypothetical protein [Thermoactinomyces intermedius]MBA4549834.1 hypothetical protein [Thermoactinomyces intermedius]MBH8596158.1 hypothetical protein [Thermoactinomyces intermedius]
MSLSEMEKETVIQFDESTNLATVYTASWTVARSLKKAGYQPVKKTQGGWWFNPGQRNQHSRGKRNDSNWIMNEEHGFYCATGAGCQI